MKFTIERANLLEAIHVVSKAVTTKGALSILSCILITVVDDGAILTANNLEMSIETKKIVAKVDTKGVCAVEGKLLSDMIKSLTDTDVTMTCVEDRSVTIMSGKSIFKVMSEDPYGFPMIPEVKKGRGIIVGKGVLKKAIKQTIFSISIDEMKPILMGALFEVENNVLKLITVDGFRISLQEIKDISEYSNTSFIIPGKTLSEVFKILSNSVEEVAIFPCNNHVIFQFDECTVVSRLLEGNFIDYQTPLKSNMSITVIINRQKLLSAIERASLVTVDTKKIPINWTVSKERIEVSSNTEKYSSKEVVEVIQHDGIDEIKISFNGRFLSDVLSSIEDEEIKILLEESHRPVIMRSVQGNTSYQYLILPVRLERG